MFLGCAGRNERFCGARNRYLNTCLRKRIVLSHNCSMRLICMLITSLMCWSAAPVLAQSGASDAPRAPLPPMRWSHMENNRLWNASALQALQTHGSALVDMVPADIENWCPYYEVAGAPGREAFWVGFMSALAKHESTYKPRAVGGGGKWYGLLQIAPATARGYECRAGSGEALKDGGDNLSCAIRIMAVTVPRDGVIFARDNKWRGVAADWGPMRVPSKRRDIAAWVGAQPYCAAPPEPVKVNRQRARQTHGEDR